MNTIDPFVAFASYNPTIFDPNSIAKKQLQSKTNISSIGSHLQSPLSSIGSRLTVDSLTPKNIWPAVDPKSLDYFSVNGNKSVFSEMA
jgi:hypothetical protein